MNLGKNPSTLDYFPFLPDIFIMFGLATSSQEDVAHSNRIAVFYLLFQLSPMNKKVKAKPCALHSFISFLDSLIILGIDIPFIMSKCDGCRFDCSTALPFLHTTFE